MWLVMLFRNEVGRLSVFRVNSCGFGVVGKGVVR